MLHVKALYGIPTMGFRGEGRKFKVSAGSNPAASKTFNSCVPVFKPAALLTCVWRQSPSTRLSHQLSSGLPHALSLLDCLS